MTDPTNHPEKGADHGAGKGAGRAEEPSALLQWDQPARTDGGRGAQAAEAAQAAQGGGGHKWLQPWPIAAVILGLIVAWQWWDSRTTMSALRTEVASKLHESDTDSRDARVTARSAQEAVREAQARLAQLDGKLTESQNQQVALEALYQELSRNRDEWALAEIDQILTIASQQLQLAGNVQAALVALQTADARLARGDRPQFIPLRKVLARDIERLKATPSIDVVGLTLKLDQVSALVDSVPLVIDERLKPDTGAARPADGGFWSRFGHEVWDELKSLVRIEVMDKPDPGLVSPTQAFFLRENLKLRLLNARLALLSRNETVYRQDLRTAQAWVDRWFDARARQTQAMQTTLKQLAAVSVQIEIPTIAESLNAVRNYKIARDRGR
jgi:uroporphyrin-3 C-methyltransferase